MQSVGNLSRGSSEFLFQCGLQDRWHIGFCLSKHCHHSFNPYCLFNHLLCFFFIWCAQNEGLADRNSRCANLLVVGRRQYWAQHLAEPVDKEIYCMLSKLACAWVFEPPGVGAFVKGSDSCSSLQPPISSISLGLRCRSWEVESLQPMYSWKFTHYHPKSHK